MTDYKDYGDNEIYLAHVFINMSKRQIKLVSEDGYEDTVTWKFDREGSEGFSETTSAMIECMDEDLITIF
tara:strand:- start:453 stop:662 length:210 start_codon:yes stop_codon:yes gene_type:complete